MYKVIKFVRKTPYIEMNHWYVINKQPQQQQKVILLIIILIIMITMIKMMIIIRACMFKRTRKKIDQEYKNYQDIWKERWSVCGTV